MSPSFRDYQEANYPERYMTESDLESHKEQDLEADEKRLRKAWTDNTYPLTLETYIEHLEIKHEHRIDLYHRQYMFATKKSEQQAAEIDQLKGQLDWLNKDILKKERIHKRQKQTLARRLKKILNEYELVETDEE